MSLVADRVKETSTTTGTGTYDLDGAVTGFQGFVAGIGDGNPCYYCVEDGTDWEVGIGTVTDATPDTLSRDTILASSNGDAAVNWGSGAKRVFVTIPADQAVSGRPQTSHAANFDIKDSGYHDNIGAGGTITGTFADESGIEAVVARVDDYEVRILPPSGKQILWSGGRMAVDEYLAIVSEVGVLNCIVNPAGDVQVISEFGDIQEQTP